MILMWKTVTTESVVRLGLILSDQTLVTKSPHWGDTVVGNGLIKPMPHRQIALALGRCAIKNGVLVINHHSFGGREVWTSDHTMFSPGVWNWYSQIENQFPCSTYKVEKVDATRWTSATSGASILCENMGDGVWKATYTQPSKKSHYAQLWADMR